MGFSAVADLGSIETDKCILHVVVDERGRRGIHKALTVDEEVYHRYFRQEAKRMESLNHARIPKLLSMNEEVKGREGFVMEYVEGRALGDGDMRILIALKSISLGQIVFGVLDVLKYLHDEVTCIHGDIKPDNIVMTGEEKIHLIDFGNAKDIDHNSTMQGHPIFVRQGLKRIPSFDLACLAGSILWWMVDTKSYGYRSVLEVAKTLPDDGLNGFLRRVILGEAEDVLQSVDAFRKEVEKYVS